ncbi:HEAT repeat domain-containing protein [Streptomyces sp. NPDC057705]|uniref:HEAT repeat domain-containing protein n=1 Tax=Streptomyces sp. NPDC057705 TaxID=3346222 RepID=UPI00367B5EE4
MTLSENDLRQRLSAIEPTRATYAGIGPGDVDALRTLLGGKETRLAVRAVHALGLIDSDAAHETILSTVRDPRPEVRTSLAHVAERLPVDLSNQVLAALLNDPDIGVRKFAIRSVGPRNAEVLRAKVEQVSHSDENQGLRRVAYERVRGSGRGRATGT